MYLAEAPPGSHPLTPVCGNGSEYLNLVVVKFFYCAFTLDTLANQIDVVAQPQIGATAATVAPGASETVNGGDFGLLSGVTVFIDRSGGTVLGTTRAGDQGAFTVTGTIPASVPAGTHKLVAVGSDGRQATTAITVG